MNLRGQGRESTLRNPPAFRPPRRIQSIPFPRTPPSPRGATVLPDRRCVHNVNRGPPAANPKGSRLDRRRIPRSQSQPIEQSGCAACGCGGIASWKERVLIRGSADGGRRQGTRRAQAHPGYDAERRTPVRSQMTPQAWRGSILRPGNRRNGTRPEKDIPWRGRSRAGPG